MGIEFNEAQRQISSEIRRFYLENLDTSSLKVSVASGQAQTILVELLNPVILTSMHRISILGKVYLVSTLETKKVLQSKYSTPGINRFPKIVDDFIKTGKSSDLLSLNQYENREALSEVRMLQRIYPRNVSKSVSFLSNIDPIFAVTEYTIDGKHTSGVPLKSIEIPLIITTDSARFQFTSVKGIKISDGRLEKDMIINLIGAQIIVNEVVNNIVTTESKSKKGIGDITAISSILLLGLGVTMIITRKARFWEFGVPLFILGILMFWLRYLSEWGKQYFAPPEIEIVGEAPLEVEFIGELS